LAKGLTREQLNAASALSIKEHAEKAIVALGAPEVAFYFLENPAELGHINSLPPLAAIAEISRIQRELANDKAERRPVSQGPAPIKPIRKSAPTSTGLNDDLDIGTWMDRRKAQRKGR
jgi:hypothetical protein